MFAFFLNVNSFIHSIFELYHNGQLTDEDHD